MKKKAFLFLFISIIFTSCLTELDGVLFHFEGETVPVMGEKGKEEFTYLLKEPVTVSSSGQSVYLEYASEKAVEAEASGPGEETFTFPLPGIKGKKIHYLIPVRKGFVLSRLTVKDAEKGGGDFSLFSAGVEETAFGYYSNNGKSGNTLVLQKGMETDGSFSFEFRDLVSAVDRRLNQIQIAVKYDYPESGNGMANVILSSDTESGRHLVSLLKGGSSLYFYSGEEGFIPDSIRFEGESGSNPDIPGFRITSVEIKPFSRLVPDDYKPVPADIGVMLKYPHDLWRRSDFEIFSWNLFPDFLLIDFRDYALQSSFLKRLAFFLEKKGYAGKLADDKTLARLHGWNAHDYRAEDLALFFNTAVDTGFSLNTDELRLLDILIKNGILKKKGGRIIPVSGGFLSYSRESSDRLRYLFITHEGYHGVYFSTPGYREAVAEVWNGLSETEHDFWRTFLDWKRYNIKDNYLVVNEFQAYLMQQKIKNIDGYYKDYIIPRMKKSLPGKAGELDLFLKEYPDHFVRSGKLVENALFDLCGLTSGELRCVRN